MTRLYPAAPVLSLTSVGFTNVVLSWTDISLRGIPVIGYQVWRGVGWRPQSFSLVGTTAQGVLTFNDTSALQATTYTYYVVGNYDSNRFTSWSNYIPATTLSVKYLYSLNASAMLVFDVSTPTSPSLAANDTTEFAALASYGEMADSQFMFFCNGNTIYIFRWNLAPTHVTLVATIASCNGMVVRRGMADRNNILFTFDSGTEALKSYDISNPASPVLKTTIAVPLAGGTHDPTSLAYDSGTNSINACWSNFQVQVTAYQYPVANGGTIGALTSSTSITTGINASVVGMGFFRKAAYFVERVLADLTAWVVGHTPAYPQLPFISGGWFGVARVSDHYLFLTTSTPNASYQSILIFDLDNWTLTAPLYQLGGLNTTCNSLFVGGSLLAFCIGSTLYTYDISALLLNGGAPVSLGSLGSLPSVPNGLTGFIETWDGQNCGCST